MEETRVWLLFASKEGKNWCCLQVGQSKYNVKGEIEDIIKFLHNAKNFKINEEMQFKNSAFYEKKVCVEMVKKIVESEADNDEKSE